MLNIPGIEPFTLWNSGREDSMRADLWRDQASDQVAVSTGANMVHYVMVALAKFVAVHAYRHSLMRRTDWA